MCSFVVIQENIMNTSMSWGNSLGYVSDQQIVR